MQWVGWKGPQTVPRAGRPPPHAAQSPPAALGTAAYGSGQHCRGLAARPHLRVLRGGGSDAQIPQPLLQRLPQPRRRRHAAPPLSRPPGARKCWGATWRSCRQGGASRREVNPPHAVIGRERGGHCACAVFSVTRCMRRAARMVSGAGRQWVVAAFLRAGRAAGTVLGGVACGGSALTAPGCGVRRFLSSWRDSRRCERTESRAPAGGCLEDGTEPHVRGDSRGTERGTCECR